MRNDNRRPRRDQSSGNPRRFNDSQRRQHSGPKEMHKTTCADCGKECEVPFKPTGDRPVYCKDCFSKHKPKRF
ncbi:MAG: CxxC-x17-CxxC domain-containing protein [Nanoarchaeota archaeon]